MKNRSCVCLPLCYKEKDLPKRNPEILEMVQKLLSLISILIFNYSIKCVYKHIRPNKSIFLP